MCWSISSPRPSLPLSGYEIVRSKEYAVAEATRQKQAVWAAAALFEPVRWDDPWLRERSGHVWYVPLQSPEDKVHYLRAVSQKRRGEARLILNACGPSVQEVYAKGKWKMLLTEGGGYVLLRGGEQVGVSTTRNAWHTVRAAWAKEQRDGRSDQSPAFKDIFGFRTWEMRSGILFSPQQNTPWPTPMLEAENWSVSAALRGRAGIHARLVPRSWKERYNTGYDAPTYVCGIVERFGQSVVGETGWRAERVVIRALAAADFNQQMALMATYPEVPVFLRKKERIPLKGE